MRNYRRGEVEKSKAKTIIFNSQVWRTRVREERRIQPHRVILGEQPQLVQVPCGPSSSRPKSTQGVHARHAKRSARPGFGFGVKLYGSAMCSLGWLPSRYSWSSDLKLLYSSAIWVHVARCCCSLWPVIVPSMRDLEFRCCAGSGGRALESFGESDKDTRSTDGCFVRWVFPGEAHTRGVGRSGRRNVARRRRRGGQATRPDRFQFFSFPADTGQRPRLRGNAAVVLPTLSELVIPQVRHFEGGGVAWFVVQNIN